MKELPPPIRLTNERLTVSHPCCAASPLTLPLATTTKLVSEGPKKYTCHTRSFTAEIFVYSSCTFSTIGFRFSSIRNCTGWKDYRKLQIIYLIIWKSSSNHLLASNQPTDFIWRHFHFDRLSERASERANDLTN